MMTDDMALLREYTRHNSEEAFAALVSSHVNLVYSVALQEVHDPHLAEEITQAVFLILARKADSLGDKTILPGWLCRTARYASANALTIQRRRQEREKEAYMQSVLNEAEPDVWTQIAPLLGGAMKQLAQKDHDAVVLRFFEGKSFQEIGVAFGASENAAKKRVAYALEKLRKFFTKRGIDSTAATIAEQISTHSIQAAPVGLAKTVTAVAIAKGATASISTLTLIKGTLKIMAWTKAKTAIVVGVGILLAAGPTTVTLKEIQKHKFNDSWRTQDALAMLEKVDQVPPQIRILPSKFSPTKSRPPGNWSSPHQHNWAIGVAVPAEIVVRAAYGCEHPDRVVLNTSLPGGNYDFIANLADGSQEALQRVVRQKFGVIAKWEMLETNALLLTVKIPDAPSLSPTAKKYPPGEWHGRMSYNVSDKPLTNLVNWLEAQAGIPIIDSTGLTGRFDVSLKWNESNIQQAQQGLSDALRQALLNQLGLELVPGTVPVEMLVVEEERPGTD